MAICGYLNEGQDNSCPTLQKGYIQELQLINFEDVDDFTITKECDEATPKHRVAFSLKEGTKSVTFAGIRAGNQIRAWYSKSRDDNGFPMYTHHVQVIITRATEAQKCILKSLDSGLFIAAARLRNYESAQSGEITEAVEILGFGNGLTTADYDYNITENGGVTVIEMVSQEGMEESDVPYMYVAATEGSEIEDWDDNFAGAEISA